MNEVEVVKSFAAFVFPFLKPVGLIHTIIVPRLEYGGLNSLLYILNVNIFIIHCYFDL